MMKRLINLLLLAFLLCSSGCWDRVEIEETGFIVGAAIDFAEDKEIEEHAERENPEKQKGTKRFTLTLQKVVPAMLSSGKGGSGGGGSAAGQPYENLVSDGDTMFEITRTLATRSSRPPFFEHIKIILISEEVARSKEFAHVLDFFIRYPEMRRGALLLITKGRARDLLDISTAEEKLPSMYIYSITQNKDKNARMLPPTRMGDIHEHLLQKGSYNIQRITEGKRDVKITGTAVMQGSHNQMVGYLGEEETEGLNFLTGEIIGGLVEGKIGKRLTVFDISETRLHIEADLSNKQNFHFTLKIETEGNIPETMENFNVLNEKKLKKFEESVAENIKGMCTKVIEKTQKDFEVDVLKLGSYIKQHNYKLWEQIKNDWEEGEKYFTKSDIDVEVKVKIRNMGSIIRSEL